MQALIGESDIVIQLNTIKSEVIYTFISLIIYVSSYLYFDNHLLIIPFILCAYKLLFVHGSKMIIKNKLLNPNSMNGYYKGWYRICMSNELKNGEVKTFKIVGKEVVVYRDLNGKVHALDPYCSHQGAHLGLGKVTTSGSIRCAFHGWCFDEEGKCKTSDLLIHPTCKSAPRDINSWIICEERGLVYIWYGSDKPLHEINKLPNQDNIRHIGYVSYHIQSNIVDVAENHVDFLHFYWVHSKHNQWAGICFDNKPSDLIVADDGQSFTINQPAYIQIFGYKIAKFKSTNIVTGLSIGQFDFLDFIFASLAITPVDEKHLVSTVDFYLPWYAPAFLGKILFSIIAVGVPIDDLVIWNTKKFVKKPALMNSEYDHITTFRRYGEKFRMNEQYNLLDW